MIRSGNPALKDSTFSDPRLVASETRMTLEGTVNKTGILLVLCFMAATFTWHQFFGSGGTSPLVWPLTLGGVIGGSIVALVTVFKKEWSPISAPLYAALEGLFLGGISATFELRFPGIVVQAIALTFGTAGALLLAYRSGMIRATENFKLGITAATGGIALIYLVSILLSFFGLNIPLIHEAGPIGILFSLVVVAVAAFNLVMDFDFIEQGAEQGAPKYMEWYGAFGLMVTLVWLYLELLRLLSKLQSRN